MTGKTANNESSSITGGGGLQFIIILDIPHVIVGAFGTLGVGGGFALGAKLCRPDSEVFYYSLSVMLYAVAAVVLAVPVLPQ